MESDDQFAADDVQTGVFVIGRSTHCYGASWDGDAKMSCRAACRHSRTPALKGTQLTIRKDAGEFTS